MTTTTVEPGFANLPLDVNTENFDTEGAAKYAYKVLENYLQDKIDRPERHAIRNLMGFIDARLKRYETAIEILSKVLEEDEDNVNALANLQLVYAAMGSGNVTWQDEITQRLDKLIPMLDTVDSPQAKVIKARCLTEQGYAICNGVAQKYETEFANASTISTMYDNALEMAEKLVAIEEKSDWKLGSARAKLILLKRNVKIKDFSSIDPDLEKQLIESFEMVLEHGDDFMKAEVWVKLGSVFLCFAKRSKYEGNASEAAQTADANPPECIRDKRDFLTCYAQPNPPLACYEKALQFRPNHPPILTLKAKFIKHPIYIDFTESQPDYVSALSLLDNSIEADSSLMNQYAFSMRGDTYVNMYVHTDYPKRRDNTEKLNLLVKANDDYEVSTKMRAVPEECRQMGNIWRFMSTDHSDGILMRTVGKNKRECLEKALEYYTRATQIEAGFISTVTQWKRGECCLVLGNYTEASECYKLSINNYDDQQALRSYTKLFYTYLLRLDVANQHTNDALVQEAAGCLKEAIRKYGEGVIAKKCIEYLCWKYREQDIPRRLQMFADICRDKDLASFVKRHIR
ncbi:tetratricopeptide repeat protein 22-like [Amphiura filiformis]|uniref:tetratricopeptide repeat protein 22-like n=1 Tax=Amphiura filiformis TaxID=82378 RepID=UPI003B219E04